MLVPKRWLAVLLSSLLVPTTVRPQQSTATPADELTLEQAIAIALEANRQVRVLHWNSTSLLTPPRSGQDSPPAAFRVFGAGHRVGQDP